MIGIRKLISYTNQIRDTRLNLDPNYTYHEFTPGNASGRSGEVVFEPDKIFKQYSNEAAYMFQTI